MILIPVPLAGRFVRLEPLEPAHREPLRLAADDDRIWQFTLVRPVGPAFDPDFDDLLASAAGGTRLPFAVRRLAGGDLVGVTTYYNVNFRHKRLDIGGTWYRPEVWGTAVNPECKLLLLAHAFDGLGMNRVGFEVDAINVRSQAAVAKLGAAREGVLRSHAITHAGRVRDTIVFGITAAEWPTVRDRLTARRDAPAEKFEPPPLPGSAVGSDNTQV